MSEEVEMEYCVLNIAANPHPRGIYPKILARISKHYVNFHGKDSAQITKPEDQGTGVHMGRILVWTDLDPDDPAIDKEKAKEIPIEETDISVPPAYGINGRTFFYALREKDHRLFYEAKNELGKHLSPYYLENILNKLFDTLRSVDVEVTVEPEDDALDKILAIPVLHKLEISLSLPNADDNDDDTDSVIKEMLAENVSQKQIKLRKRKGKKGIEPSKKTIAQAQAAVSNGYVRAVGKDANKQIVDYSTKEYPKKIIRKVGLQGVISELLRIARTTTFSENKEET